ncbi:hypothetical protein V473_00530 [Sphingobium cupriresistens LL01]|uniref:Uncharacterized protein n=1 Tax=Sphingobium cupriresistens LL01 TaxID=1420583 RepID=A0A0J7Y4Q5_9SPHN|nr:hypothetical protein V473_00530 [Sphingobium cupriresistens LL01]
MQRGHKSTEYVSIDGAKPIRPSPQSPFVESAQADLVTAMAMADDDNTPLTTRP